MPDVIGWDIGGAHVKAALLRRGRVLDAAQWPCPLWQGTEHLQRVLGAAHERWPERDRLDHAVTMTGEMVDLFAHREDGVGRIAALLDAALPAPRFFAGDAGWCDAADVGRLWPQIASANWLATARHAALVFDRREGLLIDIGSTTTDLIAFRGGRVLCTSRSDLQRLAQGELVYQGVVRTPLCALARRVAWRGLAVNVMNEFFATTADVYRLTGELDPAHDQQASADGTAKDAPHSRARLARMIGLDERDAGADEWLALAQAWRHEQVAELRGQVERVVAAHGIASNPVAVAAGCGAFLVPGLLPDRPHTGWQLADYGNDVAHVEAEAVRDWARVGAPAVAVASLFEREERELG